MKGIILAGGHGKRLFPITHAVTKQFLPVYDKPMIFFPLSTLMLADIREILIIVKPDDEYLVKKIFRDGSHLGLKIKTAVQDHPRGLADAFIIGRDFINKDPVCLILGDNIFYGSNFSSKLIKAKENKIGATIFVRHDNNPSQFGVVELDSYGNIISLEEKPIKPKSNNVVTGLYMMDNTCVERALNLKPSERNEIEITELLKEYHYEKKLGHIQLGRGTSWFDCGTTDSLLLASQFINSVQKSQNSIIGCLEEIALNKGWISSNDISILTKDYSNNTYLNYVQNLI